MPMLLGRVYGWEELRLLLSRWVVYWWGVRLECKLD